MKKKHKQPPKPAVEPTSSLPHRLLLLSFGLIVLIIGSVFVIKHVGANEVAAESIPSIHCDGVRAADFQCQRKHYAEITRVLGPQAALADLKLAYARDPFVVSQCHQLIHAIGNAAADRYGDIGEAFRYGDGFCWSGYYHGVVEQSLKQFNPDTFAPKADQLCAAIPGKAQYSFDYYNCVHGLGHGVMAITKNEVFDSLRLCDNLSGDWERQSCWGGVFMENVMVDNRTHFSKFLKPDDLLYPCDAVDEKYKNQCYLMQTSYALTKNGRSFANLFDLCARADANYRDTCAQSIGRDASGQSVSNVAQTQEWCALGHDDNQRTNCLIGAVKDFVSYFHSDKQAYELCAAHTGQLRTVCESTVKAYYRTF